MIPIAKRALPFLLTAFLAISLTCKTVSATEFTTLPEPVWTAAVPANTTTDEYYKNLYFTGQRPLPVVNSDSRTAFTFLYQSGLSTGKYKLLALDDDNGRQKWVHASPFKYNPFDMDRFGNVYYQDEEKSGNRMIYKLVALDANNKQRWVKTFDNSFNYNVLDDGRIAVVTFSRENVTVTLYSKEGKLLVARKFDGEIRHIQGNYIGVRNLKAPNSTTTIDIYSISSGKKIVTVAQPQDYISNVYADFDVLSGGTLLVPIYNAKTGVETLNGYAPDGQKKWSRTLPKPSQVTETGTMYARTIYDSLFVSVGNNFVIQEKNKLSLYDTNNKLIAEKTFSELPGQGKLQRLDDQTFVFGAVEEKEPWYFASEPEPKKAIYYVLDSRTLGIMNSLVIDDALFNQADVRFHDANTFYIDTKDRLAKYVLK
ncbi:MULTISPECIES: hypothetical protein [unclassified Paenibacillus]|uniref:hypothetical protein n=1 Tax=unclassified Paenibacillus TaxID=185978 RepID=UPI001C10BBCA|nr:MULTISPECIES: hypothetical protein [unclassified Paenibacillus]MBU5441639.1 hypothetical protein [Paenibacillus sp. MSJ-34]CAH0118172.1 hypothetical protein PAE9249_00638 [Paenibacillus sp. CECT 9249]